MLQEKLKDNKCPLQENLSRKEITNDKLDSFVLQGFGNNTEEQRKQGLLF